MLSSWYVYLLLSLAAALAAVLIVVIIKFVKTLKLVEAEQNNNKFVKSFIERSPYVINLWTPDIQLEQTSQQSVKMFGLKDTQEYLERFAELSPEYQPCGTLSSKKAVALVKKAFDEGSAKFEWLHQDLDKNPIPTEIFLVRIERGDDVRVLATTTDLRDILSAKEKEQKALEFSRIAEEENRAKTRFLAKMSHEIRTPLSAVLGIAEAQLQKKHLPETEEAFLRIHNSSSLLLTIVNDILDLSKIESGKMVLALKTYEFTSFVVDTLQLNLVSIGDKDIEFKLELDERIPLYMVGDEMCIKQVLNNLLSNAIKYTESGTVSLSVSIDENDLTSDNYVPTLIFTVKDTGHGMTKEQVETLFDEEISGYDSQTGKNVKGSGLGMSIVKQLVDIMNGRIDVASTIDVGTAITVYIPQIADGKELLGKENVENLQNLENLQKSLKKFKRFQRELMPYGRVLIVDDIESNIEVMKDFLMPYKISVDFADSGEKAIKKIKSGEVYDIIFMDHMMPEMDGIETTKIILEHGYNSPIIALTANAFPGAEEMFKSKGFSDYLSKPINTVKLDAFLHKFIRDKQSSEVIEAANAQAQMWIEDSDTFEKANIMKAFLRDAQRSITALKAFLSLAEFDEKSMKNFIIHVHSMKSALNNIGRNDLSMVAAELEKIGREKGLTKINMQAPKFVAQLEKVVKENSPQGETTVENNTVAGIETLKTQLTDLVKACEELDLSTVKAICKELAKKQYIKKRQDLIDDICESVLFGDFERAQFLAGADNLEKVGFYD